MKYLEGQSFLHAGTMSRAGLTDSEYLKSQAPLLFAFPAILPFCARNVAFWGPYHGESEQVRFLWLE